MTWSDLSWRVPIWPILIWPLLTWAVWTWPVLNYLYWLNISYPRTHRAGTKLITCSFILYGVGSGCGVSAIRLPFFCKYKVNFYFDELNFSWVCKFRLEFDKRWKRGGWTWQKGPLDCQQKLWLWYCWSQNHLWNTLENVDFLGHMHLMDILKSQCLIVPFHQKWGRQNTQSIQQVVVESDGDLLLFAHTSPSLEDAYGGSFMILFWLLVTHSGCFTMSLCTDWQTLCWPFGRKIHTLKLNYVRIPVM